MAFYLNDVRFLKAKKHDGTLEHREIKEFYIDSQDDIQDLPGRDKIHECSKAVIMKDTLTDPAISDGIWPQGSTWILMSSGWVYIGISKEYGWSR